MSRRTDVPAFYGDWFRNRLAAGWCEVRNPFSGQVYRVSLAPDDVLGWVFWSRNYEPFLDVLKEVALRERPFLCNLTITGFPRTLELRAPDTGRAIATARRLADRYGPDVVRWRYDPILLTDATPPDWHRENFARLAGALQGLARQCIFSYPTMYRKTLRNLRSLVQRDGASVWQKRAEGGEGLEGDFTEADQTLLVRDLAAVAKDCGMAMLSCCGEKWAQQELGTGPAACVDWPAMQRLAPARASAEVPRNPSRAGCGCYRSVDIGRYETCGHGCVYCYAVDNASRALKYQREHNANAAGM